MEVFGVVASSIALFETVSKTTRLAARALSHLRDAPEELAALRQKIILLEAQLKQIATVRVATPMPVLVLESVEKVLAATDEAIRAVLREITKAEQPSPGFRSIVKWALISRRTVAKLEQKLHETQNLLTAQLLLLNVHLHNEVSSSNSRVETAVFRLDKKIDLLQQKLRLLDPTHQRRGKASSLQHWSSRGEVSVKRTVTERSQLGAWLLFLGFRGTVLRKRATNAAEILCASIRFHLPATWGFREKFIDVDFTIRSGAVCWMPHYRISTFNIVPEKADIMRACELGHVNEVRLLFLAGTASVFDVTPSNFRPISYAIRSGSAELVEFLLNQHTGQSNWAFGQNQTSPLQWALTHRHLSICQLLLNHGAATDYVNAAGWTPVNYLALAHIGDAEYEQKHPIRPFFSLLSSDSLSLDFEVQDLHGFTVLELAAAYGTEDAVVGLLGLGAHVHSTWRDDQCLLRLAIKHGNFAAFEALIPHYPNIKQRAQDGYTTLSYAAYLGQDRIVRRLLQLGADVTLFECHSGSEPEQFGLAPQAYRQYMKALEDYGRIVIREAMSEDGLTEDVYWEANEEWKWFN